MRSQDSGSVRSMTTASYGDLQQIVDNNNVRGSSTTTSSTSLSGSLTLPAMGTGAAAAATTSPATAAKAGGSGPNWSKLQALKQRKAELEKLLNEKNSMLQQIQKQEAQIINGNSGTVDHYSLIDEDANQIMNRKSSTSFKLPKSQSTSRDDADIEKLLHEKKAQQEISSKSMRLFNDPNVSKSLRRTHKAEYDHAQQKLLAINQNLSLLKRRQMTHSKSTSESVSSSSSQVVKSPSFSNTSPMDPYQQQRGGYSSKDTHHMPPADEHTDKDVNRNKYGSNNSVNNYYTIGDRRNSTKSTKSATSVNKVMKQVDSLSITGDRTLKQHRSDYDLNALGPQQQQPQQQQMYYHQHQAPVMRSKKPAYPNYNDYQDNYTNNNQRDSYQLDVSEYYMQMTSSNQYLHSPTTTTTTHIQSEKYYLSPIQTQSQHTDEQIGGANSCSSTGFIRSSQNIRQYSNETDPVIAQSHNTQLYHQQLINSQQHEHINRYSQRLHGNGIGSGGHGGNNNYDAISLSPSNVSSLMETHQRQSMHQQQPPAGLGGYWRTLSNKERVWCTLDNGYDNGQPNYNTKGRKLSSPSVSQSISSSSLGNYSASINAKDDCVDEISISSLNSEHNKKQKEKQWLETSLDGPMIRPKLSPGSNSPTLDSISMHQMGAKPHKPPNYRDRSRLSSQSMSTASYRLQPKPNIEEQQYLSQSTSVLNQPLPPPPTQPQLPPKIPQPDTSQLDAIINAAMLHSPRHRPPQPYLPSPTAIDGNHNTLLHSPQTPKLPPPMDIRIESPQNMTVIQQATFMPYKEESKPFEMSDFYKYSTKFRQKEADESGGSGQPHHHHHHHANMYMPKQPMPLPTEVE